MKFWDSSAIVPLVVEEPTTTQLLAMAADPGLMAVWWGSSVEVVAALARRERAGELTSSGCLDALAAFRRVATMWREVSASLLLRAQAERLLRVHPLRAADALQLAAALSIAHGDPALVEFVCLDDRLRMAAAREGFRLLPE